VIFSVIIFLGLAGLVFYYFSPGRLTPARSGPSLPGATIAPSSLATSAPEFGVFFDSFSGAGQIDASRTTMYLNNRAAAVSFAPDYSWQPSAELKGAAPLKGTASQGYWADFYANNFNGPYQDRRCLGTNCLEQAGLKLYYNKRLVALPADLKGADLQALSLAALGKKWLVGFTIKDKKAYRGEVFSFDGQKFTPLIFPQPLVSPYFGLFGFGGEDNDFLVIYGAYQGIAYRFQGPAVIDISKFFDIRIMNNGFKAEVIKTVKGTDTNWYVFSATEGRPQFLKLWQNGTPDIAGEVAFNLFTDASQGVASQGVATQTVAFKLQEIKPTEIVLLARTQSGQKNSLSTFTDRGFKNKAGGILTFLPISYSQGSPAISLKEIKTARLDLDVASRDKIKLLFSMDNQNWRPVPLGQNLDFKTVAAGVEAGVEAGVVAGAEAGVEAGAEVGAETGVEDGAETGVEAGAEAGAKVGAKVGVEAGAEGQPKFFKTFWLQVVFPPLPDKFYSPFLEEILFEYYCVKAV